MNKKRALSILVAAAMAAGTLATSVPVYADDVEEITWIFWDDLEATEDLISKVSKMSLIVSTKSTMANIT